MFVLGALILFLPEIKDSIIDIDTPLKEEDDKEDNNSSSFFDQL